MYYINFENDVFIDENLDFRFMEDLVRINLQKSDSYELKILKENKDIKKKVEDIAVYSDENVFEYIYQGIIDEDFKEMLLKNLLDKNALKIFGISLFDDGKLTFESINFGSEVYLFGFNEHSVVDVVSELEQVYGIDEINVYTNEEEEGHKHHH
ncbi:hypothetical protein ABID14_001031 [Peptoniphilus olsenii]|uniref:Uncharacterized protein n=1 Tax=Peptoniphilus olsenii TaxID=411570 RepID=A0ABV2J9E8_9FIRM